jgi:hypothetical protein
VPRIFFTPTRPVPDLASAGTSPSSARHVRICVADQVGRENSERWENSGRWARKGRRPGLASNAKAFEEALQLPVFNQAFLIVRGISHAGRVHRHRVSRTGFGDKRQASPCPTPDVSGEWMIYQSGGYGIAVNLFDDDGVLSGSARYFALGTTTHFDLFGDPPPQR